MRLLSAGLLAWGACSYQAAAMAYNLLEHLLCPLLEEAFSLWESGPLDPYIEPEVAGTGCRNSTRSLESTMSRSTMVPGCMCCICWGHSSIYHCCSVAKLCPILCSTDCSTPSFPVLLYPSDSKWVNDCSDSCPLSQWCHPTISSSVTCFSSCPQPFPTSGSFPMSQLFTSSGQSIGALASASVFIAEYNGGWLGWYQLQVGVSAASLNSHFTTISFWMWARTRGYQVMYPLPPLLKSEAQIPKQVYTQSRVRGSNTLTSLWIVVLAQALLAEKAHPNLEYQPGRCRFKIKPLFDNYTCICSCKKQFQRDPMYSLPSVPPKGSILQR